jgi:hypothetical protein
MTMSQKDAEVSSKMLKPLETAVFRDKMARGISATA